MILRSRYVLPVDAPPVENGAVTVRDGLVVAVGSARESTDDTVIDYGDAVICPGFVNAHTHLELSSLGGCVSPSTDFTDWLRSLFELSNREPPTCAQVQATVDTGITQSLSAGVTAVGDVTRTPLWTRAVLARSALRGVSFGEVIAIGNRRHLLFERLTAAASLEYQTERVRVGISPHALYTVEPDAIRACVHKAEDISAPLCIHLAETADEEEFTRTGRGSLADYLRDIGVWDDLIPVGGCRPMELAARLGLLGSRTILVHANYVNDNDIDCIAASGSSVAYCPRTHRAFGHAPHRFRDMLAKGVNVCIGTDSLASNPSLSVLEELRFLRMEHEDLDPHEIISMGTLRGARALGIADRVGSIDVGKQADLVVIPLDAPADKWDQFLLTEHAPLAVYLSGVLQSPDSNCSAGEPAQA